MNTDRTIDSTITEWVDAERHADVESLRSVLRPDFRGVGPAGFVLNGEQWLARYDEGLSNDTFEFSDTHARPIGDAVIVIGVQTQTGQYQGHPIDERFRVTQVWDVSGGSPLLASVHLSAIRG